MQSRRTAPHGLTCLRVAEALGDVTLHILHPLDLGPLIPTAGSCRLLGARILSVDTGLLRCAAAGPGPVLRGCLGIVLQVLVRCGPALVTGTTPLHLPVRQALPACPDLPPRVRARARVVQERWEQVPGGARQVLTGDAPGEQFGFAVAFPGPLDGSGLADLAVGAPDASPGGMPRAGSVFLFSTRTGALLRRLDGTTADQFLGFAVAGVGDVDGDGIPDLLVGAPGATVGSRRDAGQAFLFAGADGSLLLTLSGEAEWDQFGWSVAGAGDVDGDGVPDLLVGAPSADPGGRQDAGSVYLFSGATGALLRRFDGTAAGDALGFAVAGVGDVNGDGIPDLAAGAITASPGSLSAAGEVRVFSGAGPAYPLLAVIPGAAAGDAFGWAVTGGGDLDGDGVPDLIIGAPAAAPGGQTDAGSLHLISGAAFTPFLRLDGAAGWALGSAAAPVPLLAVLPAVAAGAPDASANGQPLAGRVRVFRLPDGAVLQTFPGAAGTIQFGWSLAGAFPGVLAAGAPLDDPGGRTDAGTVHILTGAGERLRAVVEITVHLLLERRRQVTLGASPCP